MKVRDVCRGRETFSEKLPLVLQITDLTSMNLFAFFLETFVILWCKFCLFQQQDSYWVQIYVQQLKQCCWLDCFFITYNLLKVTLTNQESAGKLLNGQMRVRQKILIALLQKNNKRFHHRGLTTS